jgi:hypothetical protein
MRRVFERSPEATALRRAASPLNDSWKADQCSRSHALSENSVKGKFAELTLYDVG